MRATPSPAQSLPASDEGISTPVPAAEIDASCRAPILFLLVSAAVWVVISSVLGMIGSLKFHAPGLLADSAFFTYGRVHPAALNALVYGFGMQAGLGVILWMLAHLGRTRLVGNVGIVMGGILWNIGMTAGVLGILGGDSTGYQLLEMPRYATFPLFIGYLMIGIGALLTFHTRRERQLSSSQWFALAALFWFPWIFSTAEFFLVGHPVRGALQMVLDSWYVNNLKTVWFGFAGLAAIFYFIPKLIERPLYSHYIGLFVFWTLALFGSWGAIPPGSPLPEWLPTLSIMGALLTIVPILAVAINVYRTKGDCAKIKESRSMKFFLFGTLAYIISGLAGAVMLLRRVSVVVNFTWFLPAQSQLLLYGFVAITLFGAIYHIVPRLLQTEFPSKGMICGTFFLAAAGILLYCVPLAIGGILQGLGMNDAAKPFSEVMNSSLVFLRISTIGDFLMLLANCLLLLNLIRIHVRAGRTVAAAAWAAHSNTAGVRA
ncbi:MAG TPA: cbb3-type cytochrome c oxidase subunit I [Verrucomicrobiae bacterium]|nr:cbb3-type cytochrome c oxidase subunit I [Verrucomicrobiae bacterium]